MAITAVIPVKGNSSRVPGKNIKPFADSNLLVNKIRQLKKSGVEEILVSSDSDIMLEMARKEGVRAEKRPEDLANESRPFGDLVMHVTELMKGNHLMWTPVTSPTLDGDFYRLAMQVYLEKIEEDFDSFTTVEDFKHFLIDKTGKPFNFDPMAAITNSQQLPEMYKWTCGCSIINKELARKYRYIFGVMPYCYEVTQYQGIDIDTELDYLMAKAVYEEEKDNV
jgi:CMP-N-acetylneuraminic acid synthetase